MLLLLDLKQAKTSKQNYGVYLSLIDTIALTIFTIELLAKITVYKFRFFKDGWNIFDFIIVVVSLNSSIRSFFSFKSFSNF